MSAKSSSVGYLQNQAKLVPRITKQKYLLQLSEDEFRDRVVRPIFLKQDYTDGRETCGPYEQGKDCYFTKTAELTGTDIYVVQTKRGKITKASSPRDNLDTIVTQLKTALETNVILIGDKKKRAPIQAFLVASGEINDSARHHILDQLSTPQLKFVDVETLIPLIDQYMPELWLNIDSDVVSYFHALCKAIEQGSEILPGGSVLGHENSNGGVLDDAFTNINVVRAKRRRHIAGEHLRKKSTTPKLDSLPITSLVHEGDRLLLVVGGGGSGKSTALKRIAYELARREVESAKSIRIPVIPRASDLAEESPTSLIDYALQQIHMLVSGLKQPFKEEDLQAGRLVVMIDGLDEIGTEASADYVMELIQQFHSTYPKCQIIVTSRSTTYTISSSRVKPFTFYNVTDLNLAQAVKIIKALAKQQSLSVEDSSEVLRQLQEVHGVSLNPLIVTIFVATSDISKRDIPPNITELFKKYTELMLGRWDEEKRLHQQIQAPVKDLVLQQVALKMHERRQTSIAADEFREMVYSELKNRGFIEETPLLYEEIVERSGLFRRDSNHIAFRHLLFQEFFAGRAITDSNYIDRIIEDDWWKRAVVFYFGEHPSDSPSLTRLAHSLQGMKIEKAFNAATTIGLALQACYFAPVDDKADIYSCVIRSIVDVRSDPDFGESLARLPFVLLFSNFFVARESLALSNLKLFVERVQNEMLDAHDPHVDEQDKQDEIRFWFIVGLLQSGQFDLAHVYIHRFKPRNPSLLLMLRLDGFIAQHERMISDDSRTMLKEIDKITASRLQPLADALRKQLENEARQIDKSAIENKEVEGRIADSGEEAVDGKATDQKESTN